MSENQDKIDELLKKLDLLISQHDDFSKEIDSLKAEINAINPNPQKESPVIESAPQTIVAETEKLVEITPKVTAKVFPNSTSRISWLSDNPLDGINDEGITLQSKTTSKGTPYSSFQINFEGSEYEMCFVAKGKWFLRAMDGTSLLHGLFKNSGTSIQIAFGQHKDTVIQSDSVVANTLKMLTLCKADLARQLKAAGSESSESKVAKAPKKVKEKSDLEKYIGENLITVIGIIILFIGVVFGVKYSIDHNLINPLTRVILGYILGIAVFSVGFILKKKYDYFSAVMVSGAMAIMYFITFIAFNEFHLIHKMMAFVLMIIFTIFTVFAAISYNRQIIAHIALVGSYAIPVLLSDGTGNIRDLFIYITIVNTGILITGIKKDWKPLYYVAFSATWIIFGAWYLSGLYTQSEHFEIGMTFATIFFILFYITFLAYKLIKKEQFVKSDIVLIVLNSTVFYAVCFDMLDGHAIGTHYLGIFTLATACIHFVVSVILFKTKLADRNLFYLSSGMVLAFLTIAIPVQLEGTWITLLWSIEALVLFWIGRTKNVTTYEYLSYPIMAIAIGGLVSDWMSFYQYDSSVVESYQPFMNVTFLTSIILCISFGAIMYINMKEQFGEQLRANRPGLIQGMTSVLTILLIAVVYFTFRLEIDLYWNKLNYTSAFIANETLDEYSFPIFNPDVVRFRGVWGVNFTLFFCLALLSLNSFKIKNKGLSIAAMSLSALSILVFLVYGLHELSELVEEYKYAYQDERFLHGTMNVAIRYISYVFVIALLVKMYHTVKNELTGLKMYSDLFIHLVVLSMLGGELMNIFELANLAGVDKLGISILAGLYAIFLVAVGIARKKAYLRIAAFIVFGIMLVKLFFYDLRHLSTISKTIVFIALGIILLIISFMYNKYKHTFTNEK